MYKLWTGLHRPWCCPCHLQTMLLRHSAAFGLHCRIQDQHAKACLPDTSTWSIRCFKYKNVFEVGLQQLCCIQTSKARSNNNHTITLRHAGLEVSDASRSADREMRFFFLLQVLSNGLCMKQDELIVLPVTLHGKQSRMSSCSTGFPILAHVRSTHAAAPR